MERSEARIKVGDLRKLLRVSDIILRVTQDLYSDDVIKVQVKRGRQVVLSVESTGEIKEFRI